MGRAVNFRARALNFRFGSDETPQATFAWRVGPTDPWQIPLWDFDVVEGRWIGAELGIFTASPLGSRETAVLGLDPCGWKLRRSAGQPPAHCRFRIPMSSRTAPLTATPRPRIADVAAAAGVSVPTVSKVLNGRSHVSEATRARVQQALEELDYTKRNSPS